MRKKSVREIENNKKRINAIILAIDVILIVYIVVVIIRSFIS